jgi:hypothetical protein
VKGSTLQIGSFVGPFWHFLAGEMHSRFPLFYRLSCTFWHFLAVRFGSGFGIFWHSAEFECSSQSTRAERSVPDESPALMAGFYTSANWLRIDEPCRNTVRVPALAERVHNPFVALDGLQFDLCVLPLGRNLALRWPPRHELQPAVPQTDQHALGLAGRSSDCRGNFTTAATGHALSGSRRVTGARFAFGLSDTAG